MHLNQVINHKCMVPLLYFELERELLYIRTYCAVVVSFLLTLKFGSNVIQGGGPFKKGPHLFRTL